ncbi:hypothetical protein [Vallitalea guaymasensis]|uniref:hypothetical protein n=1 Tax=Vallitalea guaymasensis TaxID=1185412 RepID=UPI00272DAED1|nr:hypothetical protein [Vallitalea guaymasensis]
MNKNKILYALCITLIIDAIINGIERIIIDTYNLGSDMSELVLIIFSNLILPIITYIILKLIMVKIKKRYQGDKCDLNFNNSRIMVGGFLLLSGIVNLVLGLYQLISYIINISNPIHDTYKYMINNSLISLALIVVRILAGLLLIKIKQPNIDYD